ncbi:methionyl-tRNA formyltransferase [uncultured Mailhella sp.]|uniref:methionyl-tRNA formyltransferase n=1 Tax=uncultured Mailhella sp. TaxID=1981031 RepID=UPI0025FD0B30|nr:methionyl-tRNA formyltransferase [uncultured Mailhella sp.]
MSKLRIVFMGTPDFAAVILKAVAAWEGGEVVAVYTQPDRPAGRGKKLKASATKELALELGLPVYQPRNFRDDADVETLAGLRPDVLVVAAYGLLLPQRVLDIPTMGPYNVHGSLLPQYRGAAPIQRAVMNGDTISGVTIMKMEAGLDSGPMLLQQAVSIEPGDTAGTLFDTLAEHGAKLMVGALGMIAEGRAAFVRQNEELVTHAAKITAEEEYIDWSMDAKSIHNIIRGLTPAPGAKSVLNVEGREPAVLRLEPGQPVEGAGDHAPGTLVGMDGDALLVACGTGAYRLTRLRPAGKASMSAVDFYNGRLRQLSAPYGYLSGKQS